MSISLALIAGLFIYDLILLVRVIRLLVSFISAISIATVIKHLLLCSRACMKSHI